MFSSRLASVTFRYLPVEPEETAMLSRSSNEPETHNSEVASPGLLRRIGAMNVHEGADPDEVLQRLRNMNHGSTHNRLSRLRQRDELDEALPAPP